jgi:polar amino acid transport system permease protein
MSDQTPSGRARTEAIKAVPVRHPGRWVTIAVLAVLVAMFVHLLVTNDRFQWSFIFQQYAPGRRGAMFTGPVLKGLQGTLLLTVSAMAIGIVLGVVIAMMRLSPNRVLSSVAWVYTWFFRAVPRLVLAILFGNLNILWNRIGFGVPFDRQIGHLFGIDDLNLQFYSVKASDLLAGFVAGMLALGLSEAAYMAEIVRAGVQSIDRGQNEAAEALGLTRRQTLRRIVLPQAMRVIIPPTGNETISMLKTTSLASVIAVGDLFTVAQRIYGENYLYIPLLLVASIWYLVLTSLLSIAQYFIERRFSRGAVPARKPGFFGFGRPKAGLA